MVQAKLFDTVFDPIPSSKFRNLTKEELIEFIELQQKFNDTILKEVRRLREFSNELEQKSLFVDEQFITLKNKFFGKSSEKSPSHEDRAKATRGKKSKKKKVQLPSLRYPNAPLIEREVELKELPECPCCQAEMQDSGMTENAEFLTVVPAQYVVIRQKRHKYRCKSCHGAIVTAPAPQRINPGSAFSDELVLDAALSKYCDLIPMERYTEMAARGGIKDLPPQSLIEQTHKLADFVEGVYDEIKKEILSSKVLHADETPHKMLEGDKKSNWFLWGFSTQKSSYFECHDTRSGDVASQILMHSQARYLMSDVFSGYQKAVRETNEFRHEKHLPLIVSIYCNAHARRKFKEAAESFPEESQFFIEQYKKIYRLDKIVKKRPPERVNKKLKLRKLMVQFFEAMRDRAFRDLKAYPSKSSIAKAMSYFLDNFKELTLCTQNPDLPIDNNSQESLLRNPVIGRKTWYGTHSKKGAKTMAVIFSLVESCKLNKVNPREYFKKLIADLHQGKEPYTPSKFKTL